MTYPTLDHISDLNNKERLSATPLFFSKYEPVNSEIEWDHLATYSAFRNTSQEKMIFTWEGVKGATYDIFSSRYFDPKYIHVYDNDGDAVAEDIEALVADPGTDMVFEFVAPYTGTYYISTVWSQGTTFGQQEANISIYEDFDTSYKIIEGTLGNDIFNAKPGSDEDFYGYAGLDTVNFSESRANYTIEKKDFGHIFSGKKEEDQDFLFGIERVTFKDTKIAFDLDGNAGKATKILGAVFGKEYASDKEFVGICLDALEDPIVPLSYQELAEAAILATQNTSNQNIVNLLWTNVVGSEPTDEQAKPYINMLDNGMSIGELGVLAAETTLNQTNINLVGLSATGVEYV